MTDSPHSSGSPIIIALPGPDVHFASIDAVRDLVEAQLDLGESRLALDLTDVRYIDSSALSLLLRVARRAKEMGGCVKLCSLSPLVREVVELTRLGRVLEVHPSINSALDAFAG